MVFDPPRSQELVPPEEAPDGGPPEEAPDGGENLQRLEKGNINIENIAGYTNKEPITRVAITREDLKTKIYVANLKTKTVDLFRAMDFRNFQGWIFRDADTSIS